jgi:hypothetical protein
MPITHEKIINRIKDILHEKYISSTERVERIQVAVREFDMENQESHEVQG